MTWTVTQIIQDRYELQSLQRDRPGHQVWLAWDHQSQAKVVIKTLSFTGTIQWDEVKLFEREIEVLKRLHHSQIPAFVDAFNLEQPYFQKCLVERYIHAPTLQAFLDRKRSIPQGQIWAIATQVLTILEDLHSLTPPILHRDLKPSNILIDADKSVYLIDLGSVGIPAASNRDHLDTPTSVGSYGYTPIEQFMGQAVPASDLYALGAILMELLTDQHPSELMTSTLRLALPQTLALAAPLRQWIYELTEPKVTRRLSTAAQARQKLQKAQGLASALATGVQASSSSPDVKRVTQTKTDERLTLVIEPVWNRQTIAMKDVVLLLALATLPPILGVLWAIALSNTAQGFGLFGTDMILLGLGLLPGLIILPKLFGNLLVQTLYVTPDKLTLNRQVSGIPIHSFTWNRDDVLGLSLIQTEDRWTIAVDSLSGQQQALLIKLPSSDINELYRALEQWRIQFDN